MRFLLKLGHDNSSGMREFPLAILFTLIMLMAVPVACSAQSIWDDVQTEWDEIHAGNSELYLPLHTWHNRSTYTPQQIANFNENPWGIGYGKGIQDERHNWRGLFVMAFQDSHSQTEWMSGYARTWSLAYGEGWHLGGGYAAVVSLREDVHDYRLPILVVTPLLSVGVGRFTVLLNYVPRVLGAHGDVAFFVGRMSF